MLASVSSTMAFSSQYRPTDLSTPKISASGTNAGGTNFSTPQAAQDAPDAGLGQPSPIEVCHRTVRSAARGHGVSALTLVPKAGRTGMIGQIIPVTIVGPQPVTMAPLAINGLVIRFPVEFRG